jgi:uncharacterized membrane protein
MATTALPSAQRRSVAAAGAAIFGAYSLALGLLMAIAPHTFFDKVGPFGSANVHYIRDASTWYLASGLGLLVAARRAAWRVPMFALLLAQDVLHVVNHLVDVDKAHPRWVGVFDAVSLAVLVAVVGWLLLLAHREEALR